VDHGKPSVMRERIEVRSRVTAMSPDGDEEG
jgi:hypothetical protein